MPLTQIDEYEALVEETPEKREAQKRLAWEVTKLVHGDDEVRVAKKASEVLFGGEVIELTDRALEEIFADVPKSELPMAELDKGLELIGLLVSCKKGQSRGAARRLIEQGGVYLNNRQVRDSTYTIARKDLASEHFIVLRTGKKNYSLIRFE
jgi:tyrosyl-tRNA synthetase